jgi:hypothetical protein
MRRLLLVLLMLGLAGSAMASTITGTSLGVKPAGDYTYTPPAEPRQGGDTIASATVIGSLPYSDSGTTVGYVNNYDEVCPYTGSLSPDVVYSYYASANGCINVDLCYSTYDTKVYVYENAQGNLIACNDDFYFALPCYTYSSKVENVLLTAGNTYYIVVDGYGSASGNYAMDVTVCTPPEPFDCPAGALQENEPACQDGYTDNWNGGCNSTPTVWQAVNGQAAGCAIMCGWSCTYIAPSGYSSRDTDWFNSVGTGATVTVTSVAEFPLQSILIYGTNCSNLQYVIATSGAGVPNTLSYVIANNAPVWTWEGAQGFSGVPNSQYKFEICGIQNGGPNPTETTSWGSLKNQYR